MRPSVIVAFGHAVGGGGFVTIGAAVPEPSTWAMMFWRKWALLSALTEG
jgi:hypothetical protein